MMSESFLGLAILMAGQMLVHIISIKKITIIGIPWWIIVTFMLMINGILVAETTIY